MKRTKFPGLYSCHIITHDLLQTLDAYRQLVTGSKKSYYRLYSPCASYTTTSLTSKLLVTRHDEAEATTGGVL